MLTVDETDEQFKIALEVSKGVIEGTLPDNTNGATHYHTKQVNPYWADKTKQVATIGNHKFYEGIA